MKKVINKILILILLMASLINVLGCGCKDEYSQYKTLESYEYTARYNGNTYYELEIYGQESTEFTNNWKFNKNGFNFDTIIAKSHYGKFSSGPVELDSSIGDVFIRNATNQLYVKEGYIMPSEKTLLVDKILLRGYSDNINNKSWSFYIKDEEQDLKASIFASVVTLSDFVDFNVKLDREELYISPVEPRDYYFETITYFKDCSYFYYETVFRVIKGEMYLDFSDYAYKVNSQYKEIILQYIISDPQNNNPWEV